jgi:GT2 family glycosyltransferase
MKYEMAIVVVTFNNERHVGQLLDSIVKYVDTTSTPVVIVDNNSCDKTVELLQERKIEGVTVVCESINHGFGVGNNIGMGKIDAAYYFLLNSDAFLVADSHVQALNFLKSNSRIGVVGLPLVFPDGSPQTYSYPYTSPTKMLMQAVGVQHVFMWFARFSLVKKVMLRISISRDYIESQTRKSIDFNNLNISNDINFVRSDWVCGAAMILSRDLVKETGGFDPNIFLYGEDEDLCIQASDLGYDVGVLSVVPIVHEFGWGKNKSKSSYSDAKYKSLSYFIKKNHSGFRRLLMLVIIRFKFKGIFN